MLSCREVTEEASDLLDGAVGFRRRVALGLHLMICRACRAYLQQMSGAVRLARARPAEAFLPDVEAVVLRAVARHGEEVGR